MFSLNEFLRLLPFGNGPVRLVSLNSILVRLNNVKVSLKSAKVVFVLYLYLFVPPIPRWYISNFYKEREHIVQIYNT